VEDVDRLFGLPLEDFVRERDALAKRLRGEGDREGADAVKALGKPSAAAWAANQVLRTQRNDARALLAAGRELADAQERMLAGKGAPADLRGAAERERDAVDRLVAAAAGLLDGRGRGLSPALLDRVRDTLHAVALDSEAHEEAAAGRLGHERRAVGFGGPAPAAPARRGRQRDGEAAEREARRRAAEEARGRLREARAEATRCRAEARDAGRARDEAQRRLEAAEAALAAAERAVQDAQRAARPGRRS
jgi:hypothetical protein